uniref:Uncharacterized protein n=1 Tax=Arundo donax TaxID=35708 RepID=A0A0A9EC27_ARUDO
MALQLWVCCAYKMDSHRVTVRHFSRNMIFLCWDLLFLELKFLFCTAFQSFSVEFCPRGCNRAGIFFGCSWFQYGCLN